MYDGHIYCEEYKELKNYIVDIINGDIEDYDMKVCLNIFRNYMIPGKCLRHNMVS
jgi:hypothetical protein